MLSLSDFQFDQDDGWSQRGWSRYRNTVTHRQREWFDQGKFFRQFDERQPEPLEWQDLWLNGGLTAAGLWLREAMKPIKGLRVEYMAHYSDDLDEQQYKEALGAVMARLMQLEKEAA